MQDFKFLKRDFKNHIEKNKTLYIVLLFCFFIGLILGFVIAISNVSFLGLLNVKNKNFINFINGNISIVLLFWNSFSQFLVPLIIIFFISLNYYLNFFNFVYFIYQSILLFLTSLSVIEAYSFMGFLKIFFITLPINFLYFFIMMYWIISCFKRVKLSHKYKGFSAGFGKRFNKKIIMVIAMILLLSVLVGFIVPFVLKTAIFLSF